MTEISSKVSREMTRRIIDAAMSREVLTIEELSAKTIAIEVVKVRATGVTLRVVSLDPEGQPLLELTLPPLLAGEMATLWNLDALLYVSAEDDD